MHELEKYFNLNDPSKTGPRGFVIAYDENGEFLFAEENMIVESGRLKMLQNGFDKGTARITHVVYGESETMTDPSMKTINDMGTFVKTIPIRLCNLIQSDRENDGSGEETIRTTEEQRNEFDRIMSSENGISDDFKKLTIDHKTGSIVYNDKVLIHSTTGVEASGITTVEGFDQSCFEIYSANSNSNINANNISSHLVALAKIFIRTSYDDDEKNNKATTTRSNEKIHNLGLFMGNEGQLEMFSRVVFPPYYKSSTQAIVFNYYIYF